MDKRTARKVHRDDFQTCISKLRKELNTIESQQQEALSNSNFKVYVRKRPILQHELLKEEFDVVTVSKNNNDKQRRIIIHDCKMYKNMKDKFIQSHEHLSFSQCFSESSETLQVYNVTAQPLLNRALEGGKAVCMLYGQTGSGKSYTALGMQQIIAKEIFNNLPETEECITISVVEVAGSKCYDLLNPKRKVLKVCDDSNGVTNIIGLMKQTVNTEVEFMECINQANSIRSTHSTNINAVSSRSHVFFRMHIGSSGGELTLLDLAGSERNEDSLYHTPDRIRESIEINSSHMALKQCVNAMVGRDDNVTNGAEYVPYRSSMLTRILKDCLWASQSKAAVIVTISPTCTDTEHTLHALKVGRLMGGLNDPIIETKIDVENLVMEENLPESVRTWSNENICDWLSTLNDGNLQKYLINVSSSVDGKQLVRFGMSRFIQICNGNKSDADCMYQALKTTQEENRKKAQDRILKNRSSKC